MGTDLTLTDCAERLGVHYMTVYRYVRLGRLPATKVGGEWRVTEEDLRSFMEAPSPEPGRVDWKGRLADRLVAGDESGVATVVDAALTSGMEPAEVYTSMLVPALQDIGERWHEGTLSVAEEHRASVIATRLVGRLGPRFRRRGRPRGRIVIGTPVGERHGLPVAIAADLLRGQRWDVVDLGADLPVDEFVRAVARAAPVDAVAVTVSTEAAVPDAVSLVEALRGAGVTASIALGGSVVTAEVAEAAGADAWGNTAEEAVAIFTDP